MYFLQRDALQCTARYCDRMSFVSLSVTLVDSDHIGWVGEAKPFRGTLVPRYVIATTSRLRKSQGQYVRELLVDHCHNKELIYVIGIIATNKLRAARVTFVEAKL